MTGSANVSLSAFEQQLVTDPSWILTKNKIIDKVFILFGNQSEAAQLSSLLQQMPEEIKWLSPKIARGENYQGLPYVMLDYPRCFGKEDVFAIRTFFWWGHFFSITLQLKGKYKQMYEGRIIAAIKAGQLYHDWINVGEDEWQHHFDSSNMQPIELYHTDTINNKAVLKIARKLELSQWEHAQNWMQETLEHYLQILQINYSQFDGTDL